MNSSINLPDIAIAISGFLRPKLLLDNINNCLDLFPNSEIYLLIDRYDGNDKRLKGLNLESIEIVKAFEGRVTLIFEPIENLGIKRVVSELIAYSISRHEFVIFLEDDVLLVEECRDAIAMACKILGTDSNLAFATLSSLFPHYATSQKWLGTKWPRMWGMLLRRENYRHFLKYITSTASDPFQLLVTCQNQTIHREFQRVWRWKYSKAKKSRHAFDTSLMEILWASSFQVLTPVNSLIIDKGGGINSFSSRGVRRWRPHGLTKSSKTGINYCRTCERIRYMEFASRRLKFLSLISKWSVV